MGLEKQLKMNIIICWTHHHVVDTFMEHTNIEEISSHGRKTPFKIIWI
ncbi:MAG: hypothetical protein QF388_04140 [Acidimicrobiales bacterium]|nr:hypothetical protein [Acidimicrobiales bacterium]